MNEKIKVLLVDDEADLIETLRYRLETAGYDLISGSDGLAGVAKAELEKPDIVLLDIMMPRMDGYQACRAIKHNKATRHIPVVLISAKAGDVDEKKWKEAGADGYISKPFDGKDLLAVLERYLKNK